MRTISSGERRLVLASNNRAKLAELRALLEPMGACVHVQGALGIESAEEPHITFVENALAKARHAARASGTGSPRLHSRREGRGPLATVPRPATSR